MRIAVPERMYFEPTLLPSQDILRAFSERMQEGLLLFRGDGELVFANAMARGSLCRDPHDGTTFAERIARVLPGGALNQARTSGSWSGSLPIGERVVIAHLYHYGAAGQEFFLA